MLQLSDQLTALGRLAHPELQVACRSITIGDELALAPAELAPLAGSVVSVRRASGAARIIAKEILARLGSPPPVELPKSASGAPRWPDGYVGSMAHDEACAIVAIAPAWAIRGVGIDVEPRQALPKNLLHLVATPFEREQLNGDLIAARLLFCMKEAVFKATYPVDGIFLEHHDVEICLRSSLARTISGRELRIHSAKCARLLALVVVKH